MLLLTPVMMHPWMKFMLLMLMMSMLIIMIVMIPTDDDHDNNNDIYVSGPDPGRTRTGPGPDRSGPGRTEPDQSKIHYIQSKYRVDHCLQSWIGPRVQL